MCLEVGEDGVVNAPADNHYGYARVAAIAADGTSLTLKDVGANLRSTLAANASAPTALLFGEFIRNVASSHTAYVERSYAFEAYFPNLSDDGRNYEYPQGNALNQLTFNLPLTDKATASLNFVGLDTPRPQARRNQADAANTSAGT